jgi:RNA polymerase sigma-70 factor (ECF subfamily)
MGASARLDDWDEAPGRSDGPAASSSLDPAAEAALIAAAAQGDHAAFATLYDRHADRIYRHCYYRTGNRADAEDLTQQTFLHAWRAIRRYRDQGAPFVAWLLAISQNLTANHFRQARTVALTLERGDGDQALDDPAEIVIASVGQDRVRRAVLRLAPDRRQVIMLRFIEDFSVPETAAALGKTESNVRVLQHRALADLRRFLTERDEGQRRPGRSVFVHLRQVFATVRRGISAARPSEEGPAERR